MHIKPLKVFCDVVGQHSFSLAATENGMSQSGVSQIVHQLEDSLGVKLIDRSKRPFVLTAEGKVYYDGCRKVVHRYDALLDEVKSLRRDVEGRVNVGCIYSIGLSYGKQLVDEFAVRHPKATVNLQFQHSSRIYELVSEDQIDVGLVSCARSTRTIKSLDWRSERMVLACSPKHPFGNRDSVAIAEVDGMDIVGFDRDLKVRRRIDQYLLERQVEVRTEVTFDNVDTIKRAIEVNQGAGFLPEASLRSELRDGSLVIAPIDGLELTRPLGIIFRRSAELGKSAQRFMQMLQEASSLQSDESAAG